MKVYFFQEYFYIRDSKGRLEVFATSATLKDEIFNLINNKVKKIEIVKL